MQKIFLFSLAIIVAASVVMPVMAEDVITDSAAQVAEEVINEAADITAADLGISEPGRLSWVNRFFRNIRIAFTRDELKKSELELKSAAEDLYKAKLMAGKDLNSEQMQAKLDDINQKYGNRLGKINDRLEKAKAKYEGNEKFQDFIDKYTEQQLLHMEILKNLEGKVREPVREKIQIKRQLHLENFGEVMGRLQTSEQLRERLEAGLKNQEQNQERQMRRLEIIDELEQASSVAGEAIGQFKQENQATIEAIHRRRQQIKTNLEQFADSVKQQIEASQDTVDNAGERQELRQEIQSQHQAANETKQELQQQNQVDIKALKSEAVDLRNEIKQQVKNRFREIHQP